MRFVLYLELEWRPVVLVLGEKVRQVLEHVLHHWRAGGTRS